MSAAERGYDAEWRRISKAFLERNPTCIDCGGPSEVADHDPITRRELVAMGVPDPDADHRLKARCRRCHASKTARVDGGYGNPIRSRRPT